jgi:predicted permease
MVGSAVTLLAASMLLLRGFSGPADEPGLDARGVLTLGVEPPAADLERRAALYRTLLERIAQEPGVKAESLSSEGAWLGLGSTERVHAFVGAANPTMPGLMGAARLHTVGPGYFRALGIPVRAGREFTGQDSAGEPRVVVVNEAFAHALFPRLDPIGKQLQLGGVSLHGGWYTVVGVVPSLQPPGIGTPAEPVPALYLPLLQVPPSRAALAVRSGGGAMEALPAVHRAARAMGPGWRFGEPGTLEEELARFRSPLHWYGRVLGALAALATLLAALGLAGVVAHSVERRTREIGVRMAIGARPRQVVGMVVREGLSLALAGTVLGLAGALCVGRLLPFHFHGVRLDDPVPLAGVAALVTVTALLSSWLPARRAARVDPVVALRAE